MSITYSLTVNPEISIGLTDLVDHGLKRVTEIKRGLEQKLQLQVD